MSAIPPSGTRIAGGESDKAMKCPICRSGETAPGKATVTLEREGLTLVVKGVPARVCGNCGEEYVDENAAMSLLETGERDLKAGVTIEVRDYVAA